MVLIATMYTVGVCVRVCNFSIGVLTWNASGTTLSLDSFGH